VDLTVRHLQHLQRRFTCRTEPGAAAEEDRRAKFLRGDVGKPVGIAQDLDGDGIEEIIVPQNQIPGRLAVIYKGPAGYRFQTVNSGFEGTVMALGAVPGEGGPPSLVAAVVRYTNFRETEGETQIIMTTSSE